ncbi:MAG TPA: aminoglycoside adenylyltransferase domain-containing protein [Anaerolineae bacterium]|nr:aminoglycoside adenylyltransferase domain-containing protein [Anaerolineae bacterium]
MSLLMKKTSTTYPTPYPALNAVLRELVESVQAILSSNFVAACLQGSFAVGDFDRHSDVDFIIALEEELSDDQVQALQTMHKRIYSLDCGWAQHLEGSYFPREVLRQYDQRGKPLWYLDHGSQSLVRSDHCNTVVVRWVVREHGVALAGQRPKTLVDPIPVETLRREIMATIRDWGQQILDKPETFNNRFYQTFIVLNYCRMLHDLHTGNTGSKRAGAEWAKATLDPSWAGLIDRAWDGRPDPALSVRQPADPKDFKSTLEFIQYIIEASTQYAAALENGRT